MFWNFIQVNEDKSRFLYITALNDRFKRVKSLAINLLLMWKVVNISNKVFC